MNHNNVVLNNFYNSEIYYNSNLISESNWLYIILYLKKLFDKLDYFILKSLIKNYYSECCEYSSRELLTKLVFAMEDLLEIKNFDYRYCTFDDYINKFNKYKQQIISYWKPDISPKISKSIVQFLIILNELNIVFFDIKNIDFDLQHSYIPYTHISKISYIPIAGDNKIKSFWCSKNLISIFQYLEFIKNKGYTTKKYWSNEGFYYIKYNLIKYPKNWKFIDGFWYVNNVAIQTIFNHPITNISYYEAEACARYYNARLPAENEWLWIATNRNKTSNPYGIYMPNNYELISDLNDIDRVNYLAKESLMNINQLYGNVWEFTQSSSKFVNCKGGDNKFPSFLMDNNLKLKISKENRFFSVGFRIIYN